ncbi:MAG: hypothetical protein Q4B63_04310 [Clostridium perfringens]|nr:hypothetical protein [Clostridium perfringens]
MEKLFTIKGIEFCKEDFQDDIREYEDIIEIIKDFQNDLKIEKIKCAEKNDCCNETSENYISEIIGVLTQDDEFYALDEVRSRQNEFEKQRLDPFGIQIYKCTNCNKWIINILE